MFNSLRHGLVVFSLAFPLITQAQLYNLANEEILRGKDVSFINIPLFPPLCTGTIFPGLYTIRNNTPALLKLNYIKIASNDDFDDTATAIVTAPYNNCNIFLSPGAACNILLILHPQNSGILNRTLQVGIDTRQVEIDAPIITSAVDCGLTALLPPKPSSLAHLKPSAEQFNVSILGAATVTSQGQTFVNGDVDVSPGSAISAVSPQTVIIGDSHAADATAAAAQTTAKAYYQSAQALPCKAANDLTDQDLGGKVLTPGVYCFSSNAKLTGSLTLKGDPNSAYVFQIGSTLTTAPHSSVVLTGGVTNGNITWAVGSSATLGKGTAFAGIIDAVANITLSTGASLQGRAWSQNGSVSLDANVVNPGSLISVWGQS